MLQPCFQILLRMIGLEEGRESGRLISRLILFLISLSLLTVVLALLWHFFLLSWTLIHWKHTDACWLSIFSHCLVSLGFIQALIKVESTQWKFILLISYKMWCVISVRSLMNSDFFFPIEKSDIQEAQVPMGTWLKVEWVDFHFRKPLF